MGGGPHLLDQLWAPMYRVVAPDGQHVAYKVVAEAGIAALQQTGATAEAAREKELARRLSSSYAEWDKRSAGGGAEWSKKGSHGMIASYDPIARPRRAVSEPASRKST